MSSQKHFLDEKILNSPEDFAAIYARVSSKKDNNSIKAQIELAKEVICKNNLLLYGTYIDHVSGRTTPPHKRKGFSKLIEDAKAEKFKTVIAYRHDRIVRNLKDWIELKNLFKKIGVKIIFSDSSEYVSDNTIQGDFLENLLVMVAELEPNNINERASRGKKFRREQGVYNSALHVPFGYIRKKYTNENNISNIKSFYERYPIEAEFVEYFFGRFDELIKNNTPLMKQLYRDIQNFIDELKKNLKEENLNTLLKNKTRPYEKKVIESIIKELQNPEIIKQTLDKIENITKSSSLYPILKNPIYCGLMLKNPNDSTYGIKEGQINNEAFKNVINVDKIIDDNTFEYVYCYFYSNNDGLDEDDEDYLFKNKILCGRCSNRLKLKNDLFTCSNECSTFFKENLIESILEVIIEDALGTSNEGINKLKYNLSNEINALEDKISKLRTQKLSIAHKYLNSKNELCIAEVTNIQKEINYSLRKISTFRQNLKYIEELQKTITNHFKPNPKAHQDKSYEILKSKIINYILSNQDSFSPIFNEIIKSIRVKNVAIQGKPNTNFYIEYSVKFKGSSSLSEGID